MKKVLILLLLLAGCKKQYVELTLPTPVQHGKWLIHLCNYSLASTVNNYDHSGDTVEYTVDFYSSNPGYIATKYTGTKKDIEVETFVGEICGLTIRVPYWSNPTDSTTITIPHVIADTTTVLDTIWH